MWVAVVMANPVYVSFDTENPHTRKCVKISAQFFILGKMFVLPHAFCVIYRAFITMLN